jgi:hypothetical protein
VADRSLEAVAVNLRSAAVGAEPHYPGIAEFLREQAAALREQAAALPETLEARALPLLREYVDAGPYGHRFEPWPASVQTLVDEQRANPDPVDGPPHPTCSACSPGNDETTTRLAHERFDLWRRANALLNEADGGG